MKYMDKDVFTKVDTFGVGAYNEAYKAYFTKDSFLNPIHNHKGEPTGVSNVTFEPGCRNNWHIHHAQSGGGQMLICTFGEGWYQEAGKEAISLHEGMIITIASGVKHWHGAKKDSWFSHLAYAIPGVEAYNEWLEVVSQEDYDAL
ncbi:cupin [Erysipelothrix larvae]|uniref:Cupin n=2 Tax=Erysipelothrix larvae TaxID=1514105 RepID=A0A109UHK5_9FIRM|nr:cupin domain-containing protein [Erysipelothrix larvae]AMC94397.1 cupin [Erysipelothrix larvae]